MAGTGRIYRRGLIYYIAYRWEGREYRESARSSERGVAEQLLATRLAERRGSGAPAAPTFDALAAGYLDDYGVSAGGCPRTAAPRLLPDDGAQPGPRRGPRTGGDGAEGTQDASDL